MNTQRILLSLIVIVITFASIEYWFGRSSKPIISAPHISCEVIFILILLISDSTFEKFINVILFLGIIYLFLSILVFYIQNLKKYIKFNNIIEDLPISNVISGTNLALTYLLFIWFFILFLIKMLKIDKLFMFVIKPILQYIMSVIFTFLNYIGSFFGFSPELSLEPIDKQPEMTNIPKDNSSSYIDILLECLKVILVIVAIFSVAYLIYRYFKSKLSKNELATDIVENLHEGKKFKFNKKSSISQMNNPYENSNNINIRKAYFKKVSKIKLKIPSINKQLTHIEISREVSANSEYNITELTSLYEKARYSNITCTKKDVNKAKRL